MQPTILWAIYGAQFVENSRNATDHNFLGYETPHKTLIEIARPFLEPTVGMSENIDSTESHRTFAILYQTHY